MLAHLRSNLLLVVLTLLVGVVAYPAVLLAFGQLVVPTSANGSLVNGPDGKPVGSSQLAQEFKGDEWFKPRPSGVGYNAAGSGGSNLGANNPKLRLRVVQQLSPSASYRPGTRATTVQQDVDAWFAARPDRLAALVKNYPATASAFTDDSANKKAVEAWTAENPGDFFETFATKHPGSFPTVEKDVIVPVKSGPAVLTAFFDMWLAENPDRLKDLESTPADAVTAAGSGLDPHITEANARQQLPGVVAGWVKRTGKPEAEVKSVVEAALTAAAFRPLFGLVAQEPLVNVLELNLALADRFR